MNNSIKKTIAGLAALSMAVTTVFAGTVSAADVNITNALLEDDVWGDKGGWQVEANWDIPDTDRTTETVVYADKWADAPDTGSTGGVNLWYKDGGTTKLTQTVSFPAGKYSLSALAMGENASFKVSVGSSDGSSADLDGWNSWKESALDEVEFTEDTDAVITIEVVMQAGGYAYVDGVTVKAGESGGNNSGSQTEDEEPKEENNSTDSSDSTDSGDNGKADDASSQDSTSDSTADSKSDDSKSDDSSKSGASSSKKNAEVTNGDFEQVEESTLVGWEVDWKDELHIWYADAEAKNARSNKDNNYLNIWAEKAAALNVKQTVHLEKGTYKVSFNLDANEGVDTGVKLSVGSLVSYTLPKGTGWEKWQLCETNAFTVAEEGDYELVFSGDLAADTWLAIDNVKISADNGSSQSGGSSGSTTTTGTTTTTATNNPAAATNDNSGTGAASNAALLGLLTVSAAGLAVTKKRK